jgi:hypothetical protein
VDDSYLPPAQFDSFQLTSVVATDRPKSLFSEKLAMIAEKLCEIQHNHFPTMKAHSWAKT